MTISSTELAGSIGIAVAPAGNGTAEDLIREADAAMYGAKARGRGRHQLFESGMWERAVDRFDLVNALRGAVERGEFELDYQPIVDFNQHGAWIGDIANSCYWDERLLLTHCCSFRNIR